MTKEEMIASNREILIHSFYLLSYSVFYYLVILNLIYYVGCIISYFILIPAWEKIFDKMGEDPANARIPFRNTSILYARCSKYKFFSFLMYIPGFALSVNIDLELRLCRRFGKNVYFKLLMVLCPIVATYMIANDDSTWHLLKKKVKHSNNSNERKFFKREKVEYIEIPEQPIYPKRIVNETIKRKKEQNATLTKDKSNESSKKVKELEMEESNAV